MHIQQNVELAPLTTFGIGGPARWFVEARTEADVADAARWAREAGVPLFVLGGGSNLLVADSGFQGLILRVSLRGIEKVDVDRGTKRVFRVAAGEDWDSFVRRAVEENCAGIECLAGIPGQVGGTPVQNVGAYGQEVASTVMRVRCCDLMSGETAELTPTECGFGYRQSRFNTSDRGRYVILSVDYLLTPGGRPSTTYADVRREFPERSIRPPM